MDIEKFLDEKSPSPQKVARKKLKAQAKAWEVADRVPQATSITKTDLEVANGLKSSSEARKYQRRRIREFGRINRETLRELGAVIRRSK